MKRIKLFNNKNSCNDECNNKSQQPEGCCKNQQLLKEICDKIKDGSCCKKCPPGPQGQAGEQGPVGRATGTSQIVGMAIVTTTTINSILTVRNPAGNAAALTITPLAGGTRPVSAHLVITQIG